MFFGLLGDDLDEVVVAEHVGELEQRRRDFDGVVGQLVDDIARCPIERRQELGHVGSRFDFDQRCELAEHLVILCDLLVVTAIGDIGIQLRHVSEQLVTFQDVGIAVQDPKGREGALTIFQFERHLKTPRLTPLPHDSVMPAPARAESIRAQLTKVLSTSWS